MDSKFENLDAKFENLTAYIDQRSNEIIAYVDQRTKETMAYVDERSEAIETKLLTAFHGWARSMEIRTRVVSSQVSGMDERLALAEERISEVGAPQGFLI